MKAAADSARYESCRAPVASDEGYHVGGRTLRLSAGAFRQRLRHVIPYDADRPERGLQRRESPLPENP